MSTAGSVMVEPTSPASLSTVRTSSTDALLCLPPQRTIAYTKNSLSLVPARRRIAASYERRGDRAADITRRSPAGPADRGRSQSPDRQPAAITALGSADTPTTENTRPCPSVARARFRPGAHGRQLAGRVGL